MLILCFRKTSYYRNVFLPILSPSVFSSRTLPFRLKITPNYFRDPVKFFKILFIPHQDSARKKKNSWKYFHFVRFVVFFFLLLSIKANHMSRAAERRKIEFWHRLGKISRCAMQCLSEWLIIQRESAVCTFQAAMKNWKYFPPQHFGKPHSESSFYFKENVWKISEANCGGNAQKLERGENSSELRQECMDAM